MRLHRFFIEEHLRNKKDFTLYDTDIIHQLKDVFRLRQGDQLILLDNTGFEYIAEIVVLAKGKGEIKIIDTSAALNIPEKEVWLFASLIKKDNYEWILEKCTELGVSHFVPMLSDRTEKKDLNIERAHKIIKEASEQSGRGVMPTIHDVRDFKDALTHAQEQNMKFLAFHVGGEHFDKEKVLNRKSTLEKSLGIPQEKNAYGIFVGPEGGWSDKEVNLFKEHGVLVYSLGKQVLRTETAAIAISSILLL
ncbi:16S rRNA (uracil(1498)-N(3))-methyltransferase [Patescibacteria group bacterium]|nr:16S rRNA (uracil(1498)-N(3))-methyltransferase [Patescibacteria group bacterium]